MWKYIETMVLPKALDERCSLTKATYITRKISNLEKCDSLAQAEKENEMKHYLCDGVKYENCFKPLFGLLLSAFAAFAMAVASVMVKKLTSVSEFAIQTIRFMVILAIAVPILYFRKQPFFPEGNRIRLLGRGMLGTCGGTIGYFAIKHVPLGDVSIISCSATFFVCISARVFLKEEIDKLNLINIIFVIGGLILIVQPPFIFATGKNYTRVIHMRYTLRSRWCCHLHSLNLLLLLLFDPLKM